MKRSYFVTMLDKVVNAHFEQFGNEINKDNIDNLVGRLNIAIEDLGLEPPAVKEPCESFVLHNGQYIKVADSFVFTHKWDEE